MVVDFEPTFVPLEIARTNPEATVWHLAELGGAARWPYGDDKITLLLSTRMPDGRHGLARRFIQSKPMIEALG